MKKFLKKKPWSLISPSKSYENIKDLASLKIERSAFDENDALREKVFILEQEAQKLRNVTTKLLKENVELKEKLDILLDEKARGPNMQEMRDLVKVISEENDFLAKCRAEEQGHILDLKALHLEQVNELTQQLDTYKLENLDLNQKLNEMRGECSRLQTQVELLLEESGGGEVPLKVHEAILRQCQQAILDLKRAQSDQLAKLKNHTDLTDAQVRTLTLKVAELKAELQDLNARY